MMTARARSDSTRSETSRPLRSEAPSSAASSSRRSTAGDASRRESRRSCTSGIGTSDADGTDMPVPVESSRTLTRPDASVSIRSTTCSFSSLRLLRPVRRHGSAQSFGSISSSGPSLSIAPDGVRRLADGVAEVRLKAELIGLPKGGYSKHAGCPA